ncbi:MULTISPECIES: M23 family metallopeptidase [unclassified Enterococcus]|uniref:M23 family metallopeptidase n=1 Tax=unclassified Enterococcus TaxID=2608891 RepID=UPI001CE1B557|nr:MULTISPECIES: M23 family metallopeptidase [unclassified Enterococcus]MCA5012955.1 M23 family metallopeptidase [Enterococcus sp. S23]MCA5016206.1 M23 family metallopeptidase [Enterococcus sp. S22(2020)]
MNKDQYQPIIIEFPLRGEWHAPITPVKRIPSHGTDRMGLRFAFDFVQVDWENKRKPFYNTCFAKYFFFGVTLDKCYCWGKPIFAPCNAEIVTVRDGVPERAVVHWVVDSAIAIKNAHFFNEYKDDFSQIAGNYLVIKCQNNVYMAFVHLQTNSIKGAVGDRIRKGERLGNVGHSGNSTSPHLHFQLMDSADIAQSNGLPFLFEEYEVYRNGVWESVHNQIPADTDRIRFNKS